MSATLNLYSLTLAYGDTAASNNPLLKFVDWKRALQGVSIENPKSEQVTIPPDTEVVVFDNTRPLTMYGSTTFSLTMSALSPNRYRLTHTAGTSPTFRTARTINLTGVALTLTAQPNNTLLVAAGSGTPFSALQIGDDVFIPGPSTGDSPTVFQSANEGRWSVMAVGGSNVTLVRPAGVAPVMVSQTATPTNVDQFQAFTQAGVQIGDWLDITAGFVPSTQKTYPIVAVTAKWLEFTSATPLAVQYGIAPGPTGLRVFSSAKRFLRIEADQQCVVRLNGDTSYSVRMDPWAAGDPEQVAEFMKVGWSWSLRILNRSTQNLHVTVISAE
jgi:hypothetical protein